jgi:predicted PolB exonuclease-like 3'-5' exonuclease
MIKNVMKRVWAFDVEWVPDPVAGRILYELPEDTDATDILKVMWEKGGATEEDPTPFLKTAVCRVVSVAALERRQLPDGGVKLNLMALPRDPTNPDEASEAGVVGTFLDALGRNRPQLVGFNSLQSDINGGWGLASPSLHEIAVQSGIPGKMGVDGNDVAPLWLEGNLERIVRYNECDALTTYLVWLRLAHFAGFFDDTSYGREQGLVMELLQTEIAKGGREHLEEYLEAWNRLRTSIEAARKQE